MRHAMLSGLLALSTLAPAQTNSSDLPPPPATNAAGTTAAQIASLHDDWTRERDPAKRAELADQLVQAIIHDFDDNPQPVGIADEVARGGAPRREITSTAPVKTVTLHPMVTLQDVHRNESQYPDSPVFRRITADRFEAWTSKEGWLFNGTGKLLAHVHVPRRDGDGREWFGAFLADGTWITTDLWADDRQLNAFSAAGGWKWELEGSKLVAAAPKPATSDAGTWPITPLFGWVRADKTGRQWLASVGTENNRAFVLVTPDGKFKMLAADTNLWQLVFPRAMGPRGFYIHLEIDSDDGRVMLSREEAGHGPSVGWPGFSLPSGWNTVIYNGNDTFGFWPGSHDFYIEADGHGDGPDWRQPHTVWFFDANGKYQGEASGSWLGDAANGRDLLLADSSGHVVQVAKDDAGAPGIKSTRAFAWPDGTPAVPLATYDDLGIGFFLRGPGIVGLTDAAQKARSAAAIVLAKWSK